MAISGYSRTIDTSSRRRGGSVGSACHCGDVAHLEARPANIWCDRVCADWVCATTETVTRFLRRLGEDPEPPPVAPARRPPFFISPALRQRLGGLGGHPESQIEMFGGERRAVLQRSPRAHVLARGAEVRLVVSATGTMHGFSSRLSSSEPESRRLHPLLQPLAAPSASVGSRLSPLCATRAPKTALRST